MFREGGIIGDGDADETAELAVIAMTTTVHTTRRMDRREHGKH